MSWVLYQLTGNANKERAQLNALLHQQEWVDSSGQVDTAQQSRLQGGSEGAPADRPGLGIPGPCVVEGQAQREAGDGGVDGLVQDREDPGIGGVLQIHRGHINRRGSARPVNLPQCL